MRMGREDVSQGTNLPLAVILHRWHFIIATRADAGPCRTGSQDVILYSLQRKSTGAFLWHTTRARRPNVLLKAQASVQAAIHPCTQRIVQRGEARPASVRRRLGCHSGQVP